MVTARLDQARSVIRKSQYIDVVAQERAGRSSETDFARAKEHLGEVEKKSTPKIMITTVSNRPKVPGSVMSPNPVVVSAVTVNRARPHSYECLDWHGAGNRKLGQLT
jgi:hypothetical protein